MSLIMEALNRMKKDQQLADKTEASELSTKPIEAIFSENSAVEEKENRLYVGDLEFSSDENLAHSKIYKTNFRPWERAFSSRRFILGVMAGIFFLGFLGVMIYQLADFNSANVTPVASEIPSSGIAPLIPEIQLPVLEGILYDAVNPLCLLSGAALKPGDTWQSFKILSIHPDSVRLLAPDGTERQLKQNG